MSDAPPPAESPPPNGEAAPADAPPPAAQARPAAPRRAGARPWQGGRFHPTAGRGPSRRLRTILVLLALLLALAGALAAWLFYPGAVPRPYFTAVAVDQYRDPPFPANPWTAQDVAALRGRGWPESNAFTSQQRDRFVAELSTLGDKQPKDRPLVIYLCAYALPTADGGLVVLPGDADPGDASAGLPLADVLGYVEKCKVERKLLLLDVARPFADARAGVLTNDAAARAAPILDKAREADPNLLILCSCAPGQTSLASEEMGHTVFVRYLLDGLAGKADGWGGGATDNRVTARELAAFVTANVDRWAVHDRGVRQTPVSLGPDGLDFALTVDESGKAPAADAPLDTAYPPGLKDAWDLRDRWKRDLLVPTPPALVRDLEDETLRAEARWRGGAKVEDVQAALKERTEKLEAERKRYVPPGASAKGEPRSLALALALGRAAPPRDKTEEAIFQLVQLSDLQRRATAVPPDAEAAAQLEPRRKAFVKDYEGKPFDLAWTVFQAAKEHPEARPEALRFWLGLRREEGKPPPPDYAELRLVESLSGLEAKDPAKEWPAAAVGAAVQLAEGAEQAHAELDLCPPAAPALAGWLRAWAAEADDRRQAAQEMLLNAAPAERAKAAKPLDAALTDVRGYQALRQTVRSLGAALRCRDDALTLLPGNADYLEHDPDRKDDWGRAVTEALGLRDRLAKPPAEGPSAEWFQQTEAQTRSLRGGLDNLLQPVNSRLRGLIPPTPKSGAADAEDMRALLRLPVLSASDRVALWSAWRDLAGRLNGEALSQAAPPSEAPPAPDAEKAKKDERVRALLRARTSLALLKLDGAGDAAKAEAALEAAARNPADDAALAALARALAAGWRQAADKRVR